MGKIGRHAINGHAITVPDEETWQRIVNGDTLNGLESRTGFSILQWTKRVGGPCHLDWYDYDNEELSSLRARPDPEIDEYETYTTQVFCKSVTSRKVHSQAMDIVATFLVYTG